VGGAGHFGGRRIDKLERARKLYKKMGDAGDGIQAISSGATRAHGPGSSPRAAPEPHRLLLIEDDFALRAHLAELLMQEGYYVGCAADGAEAIRRLKSEPIPSAILLDIMLPRVNGVSFREAQNELPNLRSIPTVAITSVKQTAALEDLGFAAIFKKPIDFDRLLETLALICPRR
jgi:two-component system chemotaxis response regulator CheY